MAGGFADGFQAGFGMVNRAKESKRQDEELRLRRESHDKEMQLRDQQLAAIERSARLNREIDTENAGIRSYINNGTMTGNDSGFSRESAQMMFDQGGSRAVSDAASYGNQEARRLGLEAPYKTDGVTSRAYDPTNLGDQAGLNRRMMGAAALKGDYTALGSLQDKNRELADVQVFNQGVQQFSTNPDSFTEYTRWVNKTNPLVSAAPAKDPRTGQLTGYNIMTVTPSGDATHKFISPQQAATLAGATALMQTNPTKALQLIGTVDQSLAASIMQLNTATEKTTNTGNTATHYANQDETSRMNAGSQRIMANAASSRAGRENQTAGQKMNEQVEALVEQYSKAYPDKPKEELRRLALQAVTKDPDRKDVPDAGIAEAGLVRIKDKYYKQGKKGLEQVQLPGESKLDKALEAYANGKGKAGAGIAEPGTNTRPYYNAVTKDLERLAKKPKGVSSGEAAAASEELERRKGESRLGSF
jgi:hypothetical protein